MKKDAPQPIPERISQNIEIPDLAFDSFYFFQVGDLTVGLEGEVKTWRSFVQPSFQCLRLGEAVEGHVDLHRVEMLGIKGKPFFLRYIFRIESLPPVRIAPARSPQMIGHRSFMLEIDFLNSYSVCHCKIFYNKLQQNIYFLVPVF